MRFVRSLLGAVVLVATVLIGAPGADAGQTASTAAGCGADQVGVVVDFGSLGGGTAVRCVSGPSSGLDALSKAGFAYGFRPGFPGMVCTINSSPNPCNGAPADAYWAYWHGSAGGGWTYSTQGAGTRSPSPGSVEGWAFGDDRRPSISPPAAQPPPTAPPPTTARPSTPASPTGPRTPSGGEAAPTPVPTPVPGAPAATADPSTTTTPTSAPTSAPTSTPVASSTTRTAGDEEGDETTELAVAPVATSTTPRRGGSSAWIGLVLVAGVVGAGAWEFRRRRVR